MPLPLCIVSASLPGVVPFTSEPLSFTTPLLPVVSIVSVFASLIPPVAALKSTPVALLVVMLPLSVVRPEVEIVRFFSGVTPPMTPRFTAPVLGPMLSPCAPDAVASTAPVVRVPLPALRMVSLLSVIAPKVSVAFVVCSVPPANNAAGAVATRPPVNVVVSPVPFPNVTVLPAPVFVNVVAPPIVVFVPLNAILKLFAAVVRLVRVTSFANVILPPVLAKSSAAPLTVPLSVSVPPPPTRLLDAMFTLPASEAVPEDVSAPSPPTPVPFKVTSSAPIATPAISRAAPAETVVAPAVPPSADALLARSVPLVIAVAPVYVLAPESVKVPVPALASAVALVPS